MKPSNLRNELITQSFVAADPQRNSVYKVSSSDLLEAIVQFIERDVAKEKFDRRASFTFDIDSRAETVVAVVRPPRDE